jgi:uroporphyrinogen decarboxylase
MLHRETMSPRERWQAVLQRQQPDRVPMDYWATPEFDWKLIQHLHAASLEEVFEKLHIDRVRGVGPRYVGPALPAHVDVYGIRYSDIDYGSGSYGEAITHPLQSFKTVADIQKYYTFPSPDWWDYSDLPDQADQHARNPIQGGGSEPFLLYKYLRGDEQAMLDLVENPEIVEYCLGTMFELAYQNTLRIYEAIPGKVLLTYVAEDMGAQTDLMISPAHIKRFLLPGMKRIIDLAHQAGVYAFHHNDGNVRRILPTMVEAGIDLLNPIQWRAKGMEREYLKQTYGDRLVFHGAMDNQYTLPFGTVDEVRQEVYDNLRILGAGGGYILAPCHNIQPITPVENVVAMYETCYEIGWN